MLLGTSSAQAAVVAVLGVGADANVCAQHHQLVLTAVLVLRLDIGVQNHPAQPLQLPVHWQ
jgi:hypothetical protein